LAASLALFALLGAAPARAAIVDWNVASGNTNVGTNWINDLLATGVPTTADEAYIRNGTPPSTPAVATMTSNLDAKILRLGYSRPDVNSIETGGPGQLDWTAGTMNITENFQIGNLFQGVVNQSGGDINLPGTKPSPSTDRTSFVIGNETPAVGNGTSIYNFSGGSITVNGVASGGDGVNVRHGTFNMSGGTLTAAGNVQRVMTIASTNNAVSVANISGGTITGTGGIRIGNNAGANGTLNVSGASTSITTGGDIAVGRNSTATALMTMTDGTVNVGSGANTARLQVGDSGPGTLNMSGGTINVTRDIRVMNAAAAFGSLLNQTGGTITSVGIDMHVTALAAPHAAPRILVNGAGAVFNSGTGAAVIGNTGPAVFEVQQGLATLNAVDLGKTATSEPTVIVNGGKLIVKNSLSRTSASGFSPIAPVLTFTGGTLELNTDAATTFAWHTSLPVNGSTLDLKPGSILATTVGVASTQAADFTMNSGVWNIEIATNVLASGADRVIVPNGTAALNGGTLNVSYLGGYTPAPGDMERIARTPNGTVTLGSMSFSGQPGWIAQVADANRDIVLTYVPEPATGLLAALGALATLTASRRTRAVRQ
jgi:hypothetical protein